MTCNSKYLTIHGEVIPCGYTVSHYLHEGELDGQWYTWKTEHAIPPVVEPVIPPTLPKEELPRCRSRYQDKTNGNLVVCDFRGIHGVHSGGGFSWQDHHAYVEGTESNSPSMKQIGGDHYKGKNELQPIDVIDKWKLDFYEGSALACLARHRDNEGAEDIKKAIHYLELILEREYNNGV